jgi:hypothetical protein
MRIFCKFVSVNQQSLSDSWFAISAIRENADSKLSSANFQTKLKSSAQEDQKEQFEILT